MSRARKPLPVAAPGTPAGGKAPRDRTRAPRGRAWRVLAWTVGILVALRLLLWIALPLVLDHIAAGQGLRCEIGDLSLSLSTGQLELRDVALLPDRAARAGTSVSAPSGASGRDEPASGDALPDGDDFEHALSFDGRVGSLQYALVDLDMGALLRGSLHAERIDVDGLEWRVQLASAPHSGDAGDVGDVGDHGDAGDIAAPSGETDAAPSPSTDGAAAQPEPIDLTLPLRVDELRVQHARCVLRDASLSPPLDTELGLDIRLSDLGVPGQPAHLLARIEARGVLDELRIDATLAGDAAQQSGRLSLLVRGLHPAPLAGYLAEASIAPHAEALGLRATLAGEARAGGEHGELCSVHLALTDLRLDADGQPALTLDSAQLDAPSVSGAHRQYGELLVAGLHAAAERLPSGVLRVAGLDLQPAPAHGAAPEHARHDATADASTVSGAAPAESWSLTRFAVTDVHAAWHDAAVSPVTDLELELAALSLGPLDSAAGPDAAPASLAATLHAPGLFETLALNGTLSAFGPRTMADLTLALAGLKPVRAEPYLRAAGLRSTLEDGALSLRVHAESEVDATGALTASTRLGDVSLRDGERTLLAVPAVSLDGLSVSADGAHVALGSVDIAGPAFDLHRAADGTLALLGLATLPAAPADAPDIAATAETAATAGTAASAETAAIAATADDVAVAAGSTRAPTSATPRLQLGRLHWHDLALHVMDDAVAPPIDLTLTDVDLELSDVAFGGDAAQDEAATGKLALHLGAEGIVQRLDVKGTVVSRPGPLDLVSDLTLEARGVQAGPAAAWIEAAGLQSTWQDGSLAFALHAAIARHAGDADELTATALLSDLALDNAGRRWLSLGKLAVEDVRVGASGLAIGLVQLDGLDARVERDAQGSVLFAGARIPAPAPASAPAAARAPPRDTAPTSAATPDATGNEAPDAPSRFTLGKLAIDAVQLHVADAAVQPAADVSLQLALHASDFAMPAQPGAAPTPFDLKLGVPGSLQQLALEGDVLLTADTQRLRATLHATGLGAGGLAGYLPPDLRCELQDGRLDLALDALHEPAAEGGERLDVALRDVALRDGADGEVLLAIARLAVVAPRVDLPGGLVDLDEISLRGVQLAAHRDAEGLVHALGFALGAASAGGTLSDGTATAAVDDGAEADASLAEDAALAAAVASSASPASAPTSAPASRGASGAVRAKVPAAAPPVVTLRSLDIELERLAWRDEGGQQPQTVLAHVHLFNPEPLRLLDADPEALPPYRIKLEAGATSVLDALDLDLAVAPFVDQPSLTLDIAARGLHGAGLAAVAPELARSLDASELADATLGARVGAQLEWPRRGPVDFDLSHGFGAHVSIDRLELRREPQGELLAGLDSLDLVVAHISPSSGDVRVASLDLSTPHALLVNRADGWHVAGVRLIPVPAPAPAPASESNSARTGAPATAPAPATSSETATATATATAPAPTPTPTPTATGTATGTAPAGRVPELRIDSATVLGLDLQIRDERLDPPLLLPINALDAEIVGYSSSPRSSRPMRFQVSLGAGEVPLPKPAKASSVLAGLANATVARLTGASESRSELEPRPVFQEIALSGRLTRGAEPQGWAQLHIVGLEMLAFAGAARSGGVVVGDGVLDGTIKLRFHGANGMAVESSTTFTDLSLNEPANGPISRYLKLPAPLDSVIFLLEDEQGRIELNLDLGTERGAMSSSDLAQQAVTTLGALIARAIAASPFRVAGTLTDAIGVTKSQQAPLPETPLALQFGSGEVTLDAAQRSQLVALAARLMDEDGLTVVVEQALGSDDVAHVAVLANPPLEDSLQVVERLRQSHGELLRHREELAAQVRSYFAVGREEEAGQITGQLREVDRDIGMIEQGLDQVLELLRPAADRRTEQRVRRAGLALGRQRLEVIAEVLREAGLPLDRPVLELRPVRWEVLEDEVHGRVVLTPQQRAGPPGFFSRWFGWMWPF